MRAILIAGSLALSLGVQPAAAQFYIAGRGAGFVSAGGFSFQAHNAHFNATGFFGRSVVSYGAFSGGFYGFPGGPSFVSSTVVVTPPPIVVIVSPLTPVAASVEQPATVEDPDRFLIIRPRKQSGGQLEPLPIKRARDVELGIVPAELPLARAPALNKALEAERQSEAGVAAFAKGEYGRAIDLFRLAINAQPLAPTLWISLAQAQFAAGRFDDATASIITAMHDQPDWPSSQHRSRALYRADPLAFDRHLLRLRAALKDDPLDPRLLFLLGVELWFDGQKHEARPLLEKAAKLAGDPAPAQAFLKFDK